MLLQDSSSGQKKAKVNCKFFANGSCKYGENCRFLHSFQDLPTIPKNEVEKGINNETPRDGIPGNRREVYKYKYQRIWTLKRQFRANARQNTPVSEDILDKEKLDTSMKDENTCSEMVQIEEEVINCNIEPSKPKNLCRFYTKGYCFRGNKCAFLHEKRERNISESKDLPGNKATLGHGQSVNEDQVAIATLNDKEKSKSSGITNFLNNRKSYIKQFSVPKSVRESQCRPFVRPIVEKKPEELRKLEVNLLLKKFPEAIKVSEDDSSFQFTFVPTDPDWPFDVKEIELIVEFPNKYPLEALMLRLGENQAIPDPIKSDLDEKISEWIKEKHNSTTSVDLMLRPLIRWLDRSIEELLASALKKYKRELVLAASGIQIITASQLREKYKGSATSDEKDVIVPAKKITEVKEFPDKSLDDDKVEESEVINPELIAATNPAKKGTEVKLNDLHFSGIATLLCSKLKVVMACGRCTNKMDVSVSVRAQSGEATFSVSCPYCSNEGMAEFKRCIVHEGEHAMGYFNLDGCHVLDILLSDCEFLAACFNCMRNTAIKSLHPGHQSDTWCDDCHQKMSIKVNNVKVIRLASNAPLRGGKSKVGAQVEVDKRPKNVKDPSIQDGKPLPMFGTCKHFKKSFRWFRFPCCGKAYPCDLCHEEAETHEMKLANRIICGFCAMEQHYSPSNPCLRCGAQVTNRFTPHWEGGKGCRDKVKMSRLDSKKYSNCSKTKSVSSTSKQQHTKDTKPRHVQ